MRHVYAYVSACVYKASVQVHQCDVEYNGLSTRLTTSGSQRANNKCKLQSEEQIRAKEDNCSIKAVGGCVCVSCKAYWTDRKEGYQKPGADITIRLHNQRTEVLVVLIYLLDKNPLFQYEGQVRITLC